MPASPLLPSSALVAAASALGPSVLAVVVAVAVLGPSDLVVAAAAPDPTVAAHLAVVRRALVLFALEVADLVLALGSDIEELAFHVAKGNMKVTLQTAMQEIEISQGDWSVSLPRLETFKAHTQRCSWQSSAPLLDNIPQ
jgi:hypothetical protein